MSTREPFASPEFVETELWSYEAVTYPTEPAGALTFGAGAVKLRYRFEFDHGGDPNRVAEGGYNVACAHRVADAAGCMWEARTCFRPKVFVHRLTDLGGSEPPMWAHRDPGRSEAVTARPLLRGVKVTADDRSYRRFWVDDALLEIQFKYQGLTIDVGHRGGAQVAVRVSGFFGSWAHVPMQDEGTVPIWKGGTLQAPVVGKEDQVFDPADPDEPEPDAVPGGWFDNLSPIVYSLWEREFLFRNDATWDREHPMYGDLPRPIVFRQVTGETGAPQSNVTFRSA
ncbi:hypothetical protein R5W24_004798 [Gemmata sp. JC717]|uniref:hypothetical protein n=1 Tax=Gemmata algarum TaxID=2975278 RepID=UPI0021BB2F31|nr:hypothetical protein [Gemmata algarum]MDY3555653.1 hypothetical protein [Gemmata algarum]